MKAIVPVIFEGAIAFTRAIVAYKIIIQNASDLVDIIISEDMKSKFKNGAV